MSGSSTDVEEFLRARERKGRSIVRAIVVLNALLLVASFFGSLFGGWGDVFDFLKTLVWVFVFAMLYAGHSWARGLFIFASIINGVVGLGALLIQLPGITTVPGPVVVALALSVCGVVVMIISSLLLLFSGSVRDFLYRQETGY